MRVRHALLYAAIAAVTLPAPLCIGQEISTAAERSHARRELELAKMELRHYWQVEYPRQLRHFNGAIELTKAEIRDLEARLRAYRPYTRFSTGDAYMLTIQDTKMCLREAQLRLRDLWAERNALMRYRSDVYRELEWNVHVARLRVIELEPADEPAITSVAETPAI